MNNRRILITGAKGQLGSQVAEFLQQYENDDVVALGREQLDIRVLESVEKVMIEHEPDVVIHCGAYTDVDGAEKDPDQAFAVNAYGTRNVAIAARQVGAKLLYVSTDFVFNGESSTPYMEFDPTDPQTIYGQSKRAGEVFVQQLHNEFFIVRTSWLYGDRGHHFVQKILDRAHAQPYLEVVDDEKGCPTYTYDLAVFIDQLIGTRAYGLYHFSNAGSCSRFEWAEKIVQLSRLETAVRRIQRTQLKVRTPRPKYSVLSHQSLEASGFPKPRRWEEALYHYLHRQL
ncbi:dTDP-4-dehydrorhamnose reductase [Geomicrobium sp. JCM 19039]|uniref:dTDP-4-dehydrorhamnose reductase n=1 Tax=Geomicrobium sp. JCM 19039 TaxID=1460636 RepID=UPI00045F2D49|nr:dTDP-4-dehydrorhamnose reductase [Geomicrobium sp. JCM 19039]GAK10665.1 dTDP-4-dehydrorhamnose reductase [Geomicrobium sp. JCM 19039]